MTTGKSEIYRESTPAFKTQNTFQTQEVHVNMHGSSKETHMYTGKTQIWEAGGGDSRFGIYVYAYTRTHTDIHTHIYLHVHKVSRTLLHCLQM